MKIYLKRYLKRFLARRGLEVRNLPRDSDYSQVAMAPTAGKVIEFIGPSGVGKSTVFASLKTHVRDRWLFANTFVLTAPAAVANPEFERAVLLILYDKMDVLKKASISAWNYCNVIHQLEDIVKKSLLIAAATHPKGYLLDEGIGHYFCEQIMAQDHATRKALLGNRHFIVLLAATPEKVAAQRQERQRDQNIATAGLQNPNETDYLSAEVLQKIAKQMVIYKQFAELAKTHGCEVLELYVENGIAGNVQEIVKFEQRFSVCE